MTGSMLRDQSGVRIDAGKMDKFRNGLAGYLVRPEDAGYDEARRIWNAAVDRHPGLIVGCLARRT